MWGLERDLIAGAESVSVFYLVYTAFMIIVHKTLEQAR